MNQTPCTFSAATAKAFQTIFFLILMFVMYTSGYSQIRYESGYFIDNGGEKTDVLIMNSDWRNNPTEFRYKIPGSDDVFYADISEVQEFGIYDFSRYVRATVSLDRSSIILSRLSSSSLPNWTEEVLFLRILVEGTATLYYYREPDIRAFFYSEDQNKIHQLINRKFVVNGRVFTDDLYKQQLNIYFRCDDITDTHLERVRFTESDLANLFFGYNECIGASEIENFYSMASDRKSLKLRIKSAVNYSSLFLDYSRRPSLRIDYGSSKGYQFGLEAEYIFPFRKNKWAFFIEPTWQKQTFSVPDTSVASYSSIQVPFGVRHYFYLTDQSRFFLNAAYAYNFDLKSKIDVEVYNDRSQLVRKQEFPIVPLGNLAMGIGFTSHWIGAEIRYYTKQDLLGKERHWGGFMRRISLVIGLQLF